MLKVEAGLSLLFLKFLLNRQNRRDQMGFSCIYVIEGFLLLRSGGSMVGYIVYAVNSVKSNVAGCLNRFTADCMGYAVNSVKNNIAGCLNREKFPKAHFRSPLLVAVLNSASVYTLLR